MIQSTQFFNSHPDLPQPSPTCGTRAKIKRIALYAFAAINAAIALVFIGASVSSLIAWPLGGVSSIPLLSLSWILARMAFQIIDYENPHELSQLRMEAADLNFDRLVEIHGLETIKKYTIVSPEALKEKFIDANLSKNFSEIREKYTLTAVYDYQLMDTATLSTKFLEEIKPLSMKEFSKRFPQIHVLNQYKIISNETYASLYNLLNDSRMHDIEKERSFRNLIDSLTEYTPSDAFYPPLD